MEPETLADGLTLKGKDGPCNILSVYDVKTQTEHRLLVPDAVINELRKLPEEERVVRVIERKNYPQWQCNPFETGR